MRAAAPACCSLTRTLRESASTWSTIRAGENGFSVVGMAKPTLHKELAPIAADYDHVVIDGPPRVYDVAKAILLAADVVVVPVQPSPTDVWATSETVGLITEARVFNERLKPVIMINRKIVNTVIARDVRSALQTLEIPILQAEVCQRGRLRRGVREWLHRLCSRSPPAGPRRRLRRSLTS